MKREKSEMARENIHSRFFCFLYFEKQEATLFWKIVLRQGATSFIRHTFRSIKMGWVIKIDDITAKSVKSRLPAVFEGDFQSPQNSNFIDDIAFLELKNDFRAVRWKEISLPFFVSENRQKSGFQKYNHFLKKFFDKFWKEAVI